MFGGNKSSYHQCSFQYQQRHYHSQHTPAPPLQSAAPEEAKDCSFCNLLDWCIHNCCSSSQQILFFHASFRNRMVSPPFSYSIHATMSFELTHLLITQRTIWYLRESFTAILCANLPLTYPLIQRMFGLRNWSHNTYEAGTSRRAASRPQPSTHRHWTETRDQNVPKAYREGFSRTESQEDINDGVRKQKDDVFEPHFITSAIEMDDTKKSPRSSSLDSPSGWQSVEHSNQQPDPYRVV